MILLGDKVVRPLFVGSAVKLNLLWVLLGRLGGFQVLGLLGVFVGPVVLALCGETWREWVRDSIAPAWGESVIRRGCVPTEPRPFADDPQPDRA